MSGIDYVALMSDTYNIPSNTTQRNTLEWFRDNGYRDLLKDRKILILDGKQNGKKAIFRSWAGTTSKIQLVGETRLTILSIRSKIEVVI